MGTAATAVADVGGRLQRRRRGGGDAATTTTRPRLPLDGDPFTLGVASGDPRSDSVILWTRLAPDPLAADGARRHARRAEVDVVWEVATDDGFDDIVASGVEVADP